MLNGVVVHPLFLAILFVYGVVIGAVVGATQTIFSRRNDFSSKSVLVTAFVVGFLTAPVFPIGEGGVGLFPAFLVPLMVNVAIASPWLAAAIPIGMVTLGALTGVSLTREILASRRPRG